MKKESRSQQGENLNQPYCTRALAQANLKAILSLVDLARWAGVYGNYGRSTPNEGATKGVTAELGPIFGGCEA